jgi:hypothetical protein
MLAESRMRVPAKSRKRGVLSMGLSHLAVALVLGCHSGNISKAQEYRSFMSPDGRFKVVVYRISTESAMPGQAGDAPGFVRLYDVRTGRVLEQRDVEMVQLIDQFEWSATNLSIKLFADWRLPK